MEVTLLIFLLVRAMRRPSIHFSRFLKEYEQYDNSVAYIFGPWAGVWILRYIILRDITLRIASRISKLIGAGFKYRTQYRWRPSIIWIFVLGIGLWIIRIQVGLSYIIWLEEELTVCVNICELLFRVYFNVRKLGKLECYRMMRTILQQSYFALKRAVPVTQMQPKLVSLYYALVLEITLQ